MHLLTSQLLIQSAPGSHWQGLDELRKLDASILRSDRRERKRVKGNGPETRRASCCTFINFILFFHDALAVFCSKRGQTFAPSQLLFLPCTWLSPEAEICHLWSLVRWMRLAHSLKVTVHKHTCTRFFSSHSPSWMGMTENSIQEGRKYSTVTRLSSQLCENQMNRVPPEKEKMSNYPPEIVAIGVILWGHTLRSG